MTKTKMIVGKLTVFPIKLVLQRLFLLPEFTVCFNEGTESFASTLSCLTLN
jgi:hypothetical protein